MASKKKNKMTDSLLSLILLSMYLICPIKGKGLTLMPERGGTEHGLSATAVLKDKQTIEINRLEFDGKGADAFWIVGTGSPPKEHPGGQNLPGDHIPDERGFCIKIREYDEDHTYGHISIPDSKLPDVENPGNLPNTCPAPRPRWALASSTNSYHGIKVLEVLSLTLLLYNLYTND